MKATKQKKLESKGWKVGSANDFLHLSPEEATYNELKLSLSNLLRELRSRKKLSQSEVAKLVKTSESQITKMEAGDPSFSVDFLIISLLALGASRKELAKTIA